MHTFLNPGLEYSSLDVCFQEALQLDKSQLLTPLLGGVPGSDIQLKQDDDMAWPEQPCMEA